VTDRERETTSEVAAAAAATVSIMHNIILYDFPFIIYKR